MGETLQGVGAIDFHQAKNTFALKDRFSNLTESIRVQSPRIHPREQSTIYHLQSRSRFTESIRVQSPRIPLPNQGGSNLQSTIYNRAIDLPKKLGYKSPGFTRGSHLKSKI